MSPTKPNIIARSTPLETARLFHAQRHENMVKYQNDWLDWDGSAYQMIEDDTIKSEILLWLDKCKELAAYDELDAEGKPTGKRKFRPEKFNPKEADVSQVDSLLAHAFHIKEGAMSPPFFLDGGTGEHEGLDPANLISCQNGLLDITTRTMYRATPQFFTRTALPLSFDPAAECPLFRTFLFQVLADDDLVRLMSQWFGYLITSDISIQNILYMQGVPRSGKGTTARVIDALVGKRNVASHTMSDLAKNFGREGLLGKSLLKFTDMNTGIVKPALNEAVSIVNAITGQDPIHIDRKFKGSLDIDLRAHVVFIGNSFPDFGDHTAAIGERIKVIPFRISFANKQDTELTAKLLAELPGILNFALDGLDDLRASDNKFLTCAKSEEAKRQILNSGNPVRGFVNDECELGAFLEIPKKDIFEAYADYCVRIRATPLSQNKFYSALKEAFPSVDESRPWGDGVDRPRVMTGIRLREIGAPTTITKTFWLDADLIELGFAIEDAILRDPITKEDVEAIEGEFPGWG
jgi:putative DNA primase/helicase